MNGSRFVTGASAVTIVSMSVHVGPVQASPNNQYQLAIYADDDGSPGARIASSSTGTLTGNAWNTIPVSASLQANTAYWFMFNTNGDNNMHFADSSEWQGGYSADVPFGTWPNPFGDSIVGPWRYSIYASK
jgi:hypothetical protein